ncbi:MAG TPA: DUF4160 domain-containing protein [Candidatus Polarisedimenticolaceae bacterium]|nr:DUF4160 domain-containing protein [Candidatus Polarisedimenticolaceae bacterium]
MPEISRFYGIVIRMYHRDHERPHFHVEYAEWKASLDVRSLEVVRGKLPARVRGMVVEWAGQHRAELLLNWRRMREHTLPERIAPLE